MTSNAEKIIELIASRTGGRKEEIADDVERLLKYGVEREPMLKALSQKYDGSSDLTLLDVPGVGVVRAALLIDNDISSPQELSDADIEEVSEIEFLSEDNAKSIIETSAIVRNESSVLDRIQSKTGVDEETIISAINPLATTGNPPSEIEGELVDILTQEPSVMDTCGLDARSVYNLRKAGYETLSDIASASVEELCEARYVGPSRATKAKRAAGRAVEAKLKDTADEEEANTSEGDSKEDENSPDTGRRVRTAENPQTSTDESPETSGSKSGGVRADGTGSESESDPDDFKLKILLIGSARPNLEDGDVTGIRVRAALETAGYDLDEFDAALYTGYVPPSPHHERFDPEGCFEELHEQLHAIASHLPVYYITGDIGHGDPLEEVYDRETYAPSESHDPFASAQSELLTYVPIQSSVELENVRLTQNPVIASNEERCLLITPDLYPELWNAHDALAYIAGGQLPGRLIEDSIAPSYAMENVGPKRPNSDGAVHTVTITDAGIESHDLVPLGDVKLTSCPDHIDRGMQFSHEGSGCLFCMNEDRYFEEWLRAGARRSLREDPDATLGSALEEIADGAYFTEEQAERFREYAAIRIYEDYFGHEEGVPTIQGRRSLDSSLLEDPREVYDAASLVASSQLRLEPHDHAAYFRRFDVAGVNETLSSEFEEVKPPVPDDASSGVTELDRAAFDRRQLRGEWLFFPERKIVGSVWAEIMELVDEGEIYDAQVGTAWHQRARSPKSKRYFVGVAVPNYFDVDDVHRVGKLLTSKEIVNTEDVFSFKPILYTQIGIHEYTARNYGIESSTRFSLRTLRQMRARPEQ